MKSNYAKAAQRSTWINIYSPIILKGILPQREYTVWLLFVQAVSILSKRVLKLSDVNTSDSLLLAFCKQTQMIYGDKICTPNMHLHLHLKDTLIDFGPAHATWCYSFERFNGILGSSVTNKQAIEVQFMKRFLRMQALELISTSMDSEFKELLPQTSSASTQLHLLGSIIDDYSLLYFLQLSQASLDPLIQSFEDINVIKVLSCIN